MKKVILTKKLAFLYKFSIVFGLSVVPATFLFSFVLCSFCYTETTQLVSDIMLFVAFCLFFVFGYIVLLFPFVVIDPNNVMTPKTKAEIYKTKITTFSDFLNQAEDVLNSNGYLKAEVRILEECEVYLYANRARRFKLDFFMIIKFNELTEETLDKSNATYEDCVESYCGEKICDILRHITVTSIVCVDRVNKEFRGLMNTNIEQDFGIGRLITGLTFGRKYLYIAQQKSGFAILKYKKYRKKFLSLFGFLIENE